MAFSFLSLYGSIQINGKNINEITQPGMVIAYKNDKSNNVGFYFDKGNLIIGSIDIDINELNKAKNFYKELLSYKDQLATFTSKSIRLIAGKTSSHKGAHLIGNEDIFLQANDCIEIKNSLLESPEIYLVSKNFDLRGCYINESKFIQIEAKSETALFQVIRFTLSKDSDYPCVVQGRINLEDGETPENFIVVGAKELEILFNPKAFE